ncbi:hypothetical protein X975_16732, partial [Stegodyphus mimosarum]
MKLCSTFRGRTTRTKKIHALNTDSTTTVSSRMFPLFLPKQFHRLLVPSSNSQCSQDIRFIARAHENKLYRLRCSLFIRTSQCMKSQVSLSFEIILSHVIVIHHHKIYGCRIGTTYFPFHGPGMIMKDNGMELHILLNYYETKVNTE